MTRLSDDSAGSKPSIRCSPIALHSLSLPKTKNERSPLGAVRLIDRQICCWLTYVLVTIDGKHLPAGGELFVLGQRAPLLSQSKSTRPISPKSGSKRPLKAGC